MAAGGGNRTRGIEVVVGLLDLDLYREETGGGREAGNSTFIAVAYSMKKRRTDVGGSSSSRVEA